MSRWTYGRIESGVRRSTTVDELTQSCAALGLDLSVRAFPSGEPVRDAAQLKRLDRLLSAVASPLLKRTEVPLPQSPGQTAHLELRAWDAMLFGHGKRTGVEVEMRIHDGQELERRLGLKRRDDAVDFLLVVVADTTHNRRVLGENATLFAPLPRLRAGSVLRAVRAGQHPPSGVVLL